MATSHTLPRALACRYRRRRLPASRFIVPAHHRPIEMTNFDPSSSCPSPTQEAFLPLTMKWPFCLLLQSMVPLVFSSEVRRISIFPSQENPSTFWTEKDTSPGDPPLLADPLRILFCMIMVAGRCAEHETRKTQIKRTVALDSRSAILILMLSGTIAEKG